jgi:hypothetical protein
MPSTLDVLANEEAGYIGTKFVLKPELGSAVPGVGFEELPALNPGAKRHTVDPTSAKVPLIVGGSAAVATPA